MKKADLASLKTYAGYGIGPVKGQGSRLTPRIKMYNGTRHSTATDVLIKTNGNFNTVSRILGQSSPEMAKKYAKANVEMLRGITDGTADNGAIVKQIPKIANDK